MFLITFVAASPGYSPLESLVWMIISSGDCSVHLSLKRLPFTATSPRFPSGEFSPSLPDHIAHHCAKMKASCVMTSFLPWTNTPRSNYSERYIWDYRSSRSSWTDVVIFALLCRDIRLPYCLLRSVMYTQTAESKQIKHSSRITGENVPFSEKKFCTVTPALVSGGQLLGNKGEKSFLILEHWNLTNFSSAKMPCKWNPNIDVISPSRISHSKSGLAGRATVIYDRACGAKMAIIITGSQVWGPNLVIHFPLPVLVKPFNDEQVNSRQFVAIWINPTQVSGKFAWRPSP